MSIVEFFDVYNYEHLMAYKQLSETGMWPEGFLPADTIFPQLWQVSLANKMAAAWILHNEECFKG